MTLLQPCLLLGLRGFRVRPRFSWAWAPLLAGRGAAQGCFSSVPGSKESSAPPQEGGQRESSLGNECEFVTSWFRAEARGSLGTASLRDPRPSHRLPPPGQRGGLCRPRSADPNRPLRFVHRSNQGFMHMKLAKTKEKYVLGQNSPPFDSVPEVIHYYTTRKLPIKGAEHLSLLYPVAVRTLWAPPRPAGPGRGGAGGPAAAASVSSSCRLYGTSTPLHVLECCRPSRGAGEGLERD